MSNIKETLLNIASRKSTLLKVFREIGLEPAKAFKSRVIDAVEALEKEESERLAAQAEHDEKIKMFIEMLQEDGLSPEDVLSYITKQPMESKKRTTSDNRSVIKVKYRYVDEQGIVHEWSGRGITKKVFADLQAKEGNLDKYLVQ